MISYDEEVFSVTELIVNRWMYSVDSVSIPLMKLTLNFYISLLELAVEII